MGVSKTKDGLRPVFCFGDASRHRPRNIPKIPRTICCVTVRVA
jgi:hypothetical protein